MFHRDNDAVHKSHIAMATIQNAGLELLQPDLSHSDFFVFPKLKEYLQGPDMMMILK